MNPATLRVGDLLDMAGIRARLSPLTRCYVRAAMVQALQRGYELDRLQVRFRGIAAELDTFDPCGHRMRKFGVYVEGCRWCELTVEESRVTRRIDQLRETLGVGS